MRDDATVKKGDELTVSLYGLNDFVAPRVSDDVVAFAENLKKIQETVRQRFPTGTYHKLKSKKIGPCKILRKFGENAYEVDLPQRLNISRIFNVVDLYTFHGDLTTETSQIDREISNWILIKEVKGIEIVIQVQKMKTRFGSYFQFLVKWMGRPNCENYWIIEEECMKIDAKRCQEAKEATHTESSSLTGGERWEL
ncbi:hypothetical protein QYF36_025349 [Acer negundo]|nr:hypothetical protein QYF36_025349 [Acer negundo]